MKGECKMLMMIEETQKELTIEELMDRWEYLQENEVKSFLITEKFRKSKTFTVSNLKMEFEKDFVICYDDGEVIISNYSALMMFVRDSLTRISLVPITTGTGYREVLEFKDYGLVYIEKAS